MWMSAPSDDPGRPTANGPAHQVAEGGRMKAEGHLLEVRHRGAQDAVFRYDTLPSSVANFLRSQAERIQRTASKSIVHIGKDLVAAKHYLSHGKFIAWVENEVGIPARTAQVYMKVAQWSSNKSEAVMRLPPSALYILSAPSTPDEFTRDIVRRFEAGERMGASAIRNEWRQLRCGGELIEASAIDKQSTISDQQCGPVEVDEQKPPTTDHHVAEIVRFLAENLSQDAFSFVREAMTNAEIVNDPKLGSCIEKAFSMQGYLPEQ